MNYFEPMNVCVIYGGRDDSIQSRGSNIKNDMFVLEMETFNWIQVTFIGMPYFLDYIIVMSVNALMLQHFLSLNF